MTKTELIEFVRLKSAKTKFEMRIIGELSSYSLKGDYLNDPPDLGQAYTFANNVINDLQKVKKKNGKEWNPFDYHNPVIVERNENSVSIVFRGVLTDKEYVLCRYQKISK